MRISFELPSDAVQVVDATTYKGHQVTVLKLFGEEALYYTGRGLREEGFPDALDNADWEGIIRNRLAGIVGDLLMVDKSFARNWSKENPTGREIVSTDNDVIKYVREN
jgi:hypothetical protein